jgi:hypothetical protein
MDTHTVPHLEARPASYWEHQGPVSAIVIDMNDELRRAMVRGLIGRTPLDAPEPDVSEDAIRESQRQLLAGVRPLSTEGECLPHYLPDEVEIARISLASASRDVFSVRARRRSGRVRYRIVDGYDSPWQCHPKSSRLPLTRGELLRLIDSANIDDCYCGGDLTGALRDGQCECGRPPEVAASFVSVSSLFYPEAEAYYRDQAALWLARKLGPAAVRAA